MINRKIYLIIILGTSLLFTACPDKTVVKKLKVKRTVSGEPEVPNQTANNLGSRQVTNRINGVMYRLPRTVVQFNIPIKRTDIKQGEFHKYAPCFFSAKQLDLRPETAKKAKFSIEKPKLSSFGEPDPYETYVVKTKGGFFENKTLFMEYDKSGVLTKGEATSEDQSLDFAIKTVGTLANIAIGLNKTGAASEIVGFMGEITSIDLNTPDCSTTDLDLLIAQKEKDKQKKNKDLVKKEEDYTKLEKLRRLQPNDETILKKFIKVFLEINNLKKSINSLDRNMSSLHEEVNLLDRCVNNKVVCIGYSVSDFKRAKQAFNVYEDLQGKRNELISKSINIPHNTFKEMLTETDKSIKAYRSVFLGGKISNTIPVGVFVFKPNRDFEKTVFTFSDKTGICVDTGVIQDQNIEVPSKLVSSGVCDTVVRLSVSQQSGDKDYIQGIRDATSVSAQENKSRGWFYRVPARTNLLIYSNNNTTAKRKLLIKQEMMIAQMGAVVSIPAQGAGRSSSSTISLYNSTGALKNFKMSSKPGIDDNTLKEADATITKVLDDKDQLTKKKRELELLETQNKINDERKKLDEDTDNQEDGDQ